MKPEGAPVGEYNPFPVVVQETELLQESQVTAIVLVNARAESLLVISPPESGLIDPPVKPSCLARRPVAQTPLFEP